MSSDDFSDRTPLKDEKNQSYNGISKFSILSVAEKARTSVKGQRVVRVQIIFWHTGRSWRLCQFVHLRQAATPAGADHQVSKRRKKRHNSEV